VSTEGANAEDIWARDLLGRRADAEFLKQFLIRRIEERSEEGRKKSYVLNLDAGWGHGKTFFLTHFKRQLESEGYLAVYVNAWEDDHAEDPMVAVLAAIDETIAPHLKKKLLSKVWGATKSSFGQILVTAVTHGAKKAASKVLGEGADAIGDILVSGGEGSEAAPKSPSAEDEQEDLSDQTAEALSGGVEKLLDRHGDEALKRFQKEKSSTIAFKENLSKFVKDADKYKDVRTPLFVLVDELDRCRPSYAIELLERIKHLFEVDNIVFIIATDSGQLRHAIKAVYGESFESGRYLLRFFDRSYHFEEASLEAFSRSLFERFGSVNDRISSPFNGKHEEFFSAVIRYFGLSLRDAEQCFDYLRTVATIWPYKVKLELLLLLPLIVAYQQGDEDLRFSLENLSDIDLKDYLRRSISKDLEYNYSYRDDNFHTQRISTNFSEMLVEIVSGAKEPLNIIVRNYQGYSRSSWLGEIFDTEYSVIHRRSHNPDSPPMSLVRKYPEMVRNAGRIVASAGSLNE
jgi:hypothetical protein